MFATPTQPKFELVPFPVEDKLVNIIRQARESLFICTPYLKDYGVKVVTESAKVRRLKLLTNLDMPNVTGAGYDLSALLRLWDKFDLSVASLSKLHAKIYIVDSTYAFITSANLTRGGLRENYEYGIILSDEQMISQMTSDMSKYFSLGNIFAREKVEEIKNDIEEIRLLQKKLSGTEEAKRLRKALAKKEEEVQIKILANRIEGRTINSIFAETIVYLLQTKGSLSTEEIHPLVQNIHPDICDDAVDRIINGQHFGKKWKHLVRNAQQYLKASGKIALHDGKWRLN